MDSHVLWSKSRRLVARCALALLALVALMYVSEYILELYRKQITRNLVEEVQRLQIAQTTEGRIRELSERFGGKYFAPRNENPISQPAQYAIEITSPSVTIRGSSDAALPGRNRWEFFAHFEVESGHLSRLVLSLSFVRRDEYLLSPTVVLSGTEPNSEPGEAVYEVYRADLTGPAGEAFGVRLRPESTAEERRKAFAFDFSCLARLRGCRHGCEILPSVWRDLPASERLANEGGREVIIDSECHEHPP